MLRTIKCLICKETARVNGQKKIAIFKRFHELAHNVPEVSRLTGEFIEIVV
jgi:hypothetical protein